METRRLHGRRSMGVAATARRHAHADEAVFNSDRNDVRQPGCNGDETMTTPKRMPALIFPLRWFRRRKPAQKPQPEHVKPMVKAGLLNMLSTTASTGRRIG